MDILMLVMSDVASDPRVRIEAETLVAAGHRVTAIGHRPPADTSAHIPGVAVHWTAPRQDRDDRVASHSASTAPNRDTESRRHWLRRSLRWARDAARWILLPTHRAHVQRRFSREAMEIARSLGSPVDVVHAHDFTGLVPGAKVATEYGAALVYDAHECWTGRRLAGRPAPIHMWSQGRKERALGNRADAVITVSDGIATWFHQHYGWDDVAVVHNSFRPAATSTQPVGPPSGIVFAGRVDEARDVGTAARAVAGRHDITLHVYARQLVNVSLPATTVLHAPVSEEELDNAYRQHGLALVSLSGGMVNHDLALPNKFFHAMRAGVPVIAADLPELRRLVRTYDLGSLYQPGDAQSLNQALDDVTANWDRHVAAVAAAAPGLSWDRDSDVLLAVYEQLN